MLLPFTCSSPVTGSDQLQLNHNFNSSLTDIILTKEPVEYTLVDYQTQFYDFVLAISIFFNSWKLTNINKNKQWNSHTTSCFISIMNILKIRRLKYIGGRGGGRLTVFAGIASECVDPGGSINSQLSNFAGIASECVDPGEGLIDSQLSNFAGIASECVDPGGQLTVNSATLQGLPLSVLILGG